MKEAKFAKSVTSTYVKFVKSVTITMVLAQWRRWAKATPPIPWWSAGRPLRVATDCTGLAVAEVSLQTLAATLGADIHTVFACDIWSGSRHWLQTLGIQPILADMNTRVWNKEAGRITTRDIHGNAIQISTKDDIDLYVCGFMCTPFTPNGRRKEWADEHSKTFFSAVKTISTLRPRVAILENVMAISNNWNAKVVKRALGTLVDYVICYVKVNSTDHGVPHHRPRIYMVAFRKDDALKSMFVDRSHHMLEQIFARRIAKCQQPCAVDFQSFLADLGHPIRPNMMSEKSVMSACSCTGTMAICSVHPCKCQMCQTHRDTEKKCVWRRHHREHLKSAAFLTKRRQYLQVWRKVRKNKKLKSPPCYFELARKKGLDTEVVGQRGRRDLLRIYAQQTNLLADKCILNLSKSLGRTSFRKDGVIPTVGHGCLGCFAPSAAAYLNTSQLMCLTGLDPAEHVKVFDALETQRASDIDMLIGNAMNVPVVGVVAACALSMVDPS